MPDPKPYDLGRLPDSCMVRLRNSEGLSYAKTVDVLAKFIGTMNPEEVGDKPKQVAVRCLTVLLEDDRLRLILGKVVARETAERWAAGDFTGPIQPSRPTKWG